MMSVSICESNESKGDAPLAAVTAASFADASSSVEELLKAALDCEDPFMSLSTPSSTDPMVPMVDCRLSVDEQFSS